MLTITRPWRPADLRTNIIAHYAGRSPENHFYVPLADGDMETVPPPFTLIDGDMEADGYDAWTAYNDGVLSKETTDPHSGNKCLRITYNGTINAGATADLISGNVYHVTGWFRSGNAAYTAKIETGTYLEQTNNTTWTEFDFTWIAGTKLYLYSGVTGAGEYVEFDDITVENLTAIAWTSYQAVVSKQTTTPYSGTQCLRVAYDGSHADGRCYQACLIASAKYHLNGWARGDGVSVPQVIVDSLVVWEGTSSTDWQQIDLYFTNTTLANLYLRSGTLAAGQYVEFDNFALERVYIFDGDCEASGVTSWTAVAGATLTKDTTSPHSGTQCLKISGGGIKGAKQSVLTAGSVYHLTGYARGDGTNYPVVVHGGVYYFTGTSSTSWQFFDFIFKATGVDINFYTSDGHSEFDDIILEPAYIADGNMEDVPAPAPALTDLDMEAADCAAWDAWQSVLSKETLTPQEGIRYLRIAYDGANNDGCAYQTGITSGKYYHITGWARGDGATTSYPYLNLGDTNNWEGTTSNTWQYFDIIGVANGTEMYLGGFSLEADGYVEWDNVTVRNATASYYTSYQSILSKRIITPHSGSQCLRVAYDGFAHASGLAYQSTLTTGQTYTIAGYARGDGGVAPVVYLGTGSVPVWTGTTSNTWQAFNATNVATGVNAGLGCGTLSAGHYVEFDDVTINNVSASALTDISGCNRYINQITLTKQPGMIPAALNNNTIARFDGSDDYLQLIFTLSQPEHMFIVFKRTLAADQRYYIDGGTVNCGNLYEPITTDVTRIYAGVAGPEVSYADATWAIIDVVLNGANSGIGLNGAALVTGNAGTSNMNGITIGAAGNAVGPATMDLAEFFLVPYQLTELDRKRATTYFKRKFNL